jgi:hypothetical protein
VVWNEEEFLKDQELQAAFLQNRISALSLAMLTSESLQQVKEEADRKTQVDK